MAEDDLSLEELEELSYYVGARNTRYQGAKLKTTNGIMFWWLKL